MGMVEKDNQQLISCKFVDTQVCMWAMSNVNNMASVRDRVQKTQRWHHRELRSLLYYCMVKGYA